jgi:AcrR family transcriptional regulator
MMSTTLPSKGEMTRSVILQAAHDLFIAQGYHGTSMRQISRKAGLALGGIYNHFANKEDIFTTVLIENHPILEMLPVLENAEGETVEAFVHNAANQLMQSIYRRPNFLNLMFIEVVEFKSAHVHKIFKTTFPRGLKMVERMSATEGKLREIPPPMLIRAFISLFFSYYLSDVLLGEASPPGFKENGMAYYVDIFLHGIME